MSKIIIQANPDASERLKQIVAKVTLYVLGDIKEYADFKTLTTPEKENWVKNEISRIESHVIHNLTTKKIVEMK